MKWLLCFFGLHRWRYASHGPLYRSYVETCTRCGRSRLTFAHGPLDP